LRRGAVIEGIVAGAIDAIATDHAPHPGSEKMQEFERCPFGIIGLETALGWRWSTWCTPARFRWRAWWSCSPPVRRGAAPGPRHAGHRRSGDVTIFSTDLSGPTT
jgi:dihydroorotase-like cyclic amidohydrolase